MREYRIVNPENVPDIASRLGISGPTDTLIGGGFDYVSQWRINIRPNGYGMAHRVALKRDVQDSNGYKYLLIVHFAVPIARKDLRIPLELIESMYESLAELVYETLHLAGQRFGNVTTMYLSTPEPMKRELEEILSTTQV